MKTLIKIETDGDWGINGPCLRATDNKAAELIKKYGYNCLGGYIYVPKSVWKKSVRDRKKPVDNQ